MAKMLKPIFILFGILSGQLTLARPALKSCDQFKKEFPTVRFVVSERKGYGDVAAVYMNILKLIKECKPGRIEVDFKSAISRKKFDDLAIRKSALIHYDLSPAPDLVIIPASERGSLSDDERLFGKTSVVVKAPVFSDSESLGFYGSISYKQKEIQMGVPGLGPMQIGTYPDTIAEQYKNLSQEKVLMKIQMSLKEKPEFANLEKVFAANARVGLMYGISMQIQSVVNQLIAYLSGLLEESSQPTILLTPSDFFGQVKAIDWNRNANLVKNRFIVTHLKDLSPEWSPDPTKLNVIQVPNLPMEAFVGLMAYSALDGIVPLGAGDGFISSAIDMGIPFALVRVIHNRTVISDLNAGFLNWLEQSDLSPEYKASLSALISSLYPGETHVSHDPFLEHSQVLLEFKDEFKKFSESVPIALNEWMKAAIHVKKNVDKLTTTNASGPDECLRFL